MRAHHIMAWLQQQSTRERPDTFAQAASDSRTKNLATPGRAIHFFEHGYPLALGGTEAVGQAALRARATLYYRRRLHSKRPDGDVLQHR
jgi:hypothetical protein